VTGTIETLPAGAVGVDYSFGRPSIADMLTLGVQFASRYICIDNPLTHDKLVTRDEIRRLADAGILMMVNYEQGESTTLGGETAGRRHGPVAGDWRAFLEMPDELPIVISTDVGVTRAQYSAISDFCAAFSETGGGTIGHYHGTTLCAHLEDQGLNELTWMAMATSWSPGGETSAVHVRQKGYVLGSCDANYVRKPTPFWNFNGEADKNQPEVDMAKLTLFPCADADAVFVGMFDGRQVHTVTHCTWQDVEHYKADGVPIFETSVGGFRWVTLLGDLPAPGSDSRHEWTGGEFRRVVSQGTKGDPGRDAPIPIRFEPVYG
jgi:hypothetical protein